MDTNPFSKSAPELPPPATSSSSTSKKTVTFGNIKNASYSSNDDDENEDEDDDDDGGDDDEASTQIDFNKLLISEPDRRQYIEQQFDEAIKEYRKVTQRLEAARILPF